MAQRAMTFSEHLRYLLDTLGIEANDLATVLGVAQDTFYRWLADNDSFPEGNARARLDELDVLAARLQEAFNAPGPALWVHAPSGYLRGRTPLDLLRDGNIRRAELALDALEAGIFV